MSSGCFLCKAILDPGIVFTTLAVSAAMNFGGEFAALAAVTSVFSGMQGMEPSGRSGVRRGEPSPINILVTGS